VNKFLIEELFSGISRRLSIGLILLLCIFFIVMRLHSLNYLGTGSALAIMAVFCVLLYWVNYRRVLKPLLDICRLVKETAYGSPDQHINSGDEIEQLAAGINELAARAKPVSPSVALERNVGYAVLNRITDGVIAVNNDREVLFINKTAESIFGVGRTFAQGKSIMEVIRNYELDRFIDKALKADIPVIQEIRLISPEPRTLHLQAVP